MRELTEEEKAAAAAIKARHDQYVHSREFKKEAEQEAKRLADAARKIEASQPSEEELAEAVRRQEDAARAARDAYAEAARGQAEKQRRPLPLWARIREWLGRQNSE